MHSLLIVLSITSFWLFSPEALVLIGNSGGAGAGTGVMVLVCFAVIIFVGSLFIEDDRRPGDDNSRNYGKQKIKLTGVIGTAGMLGTALFASTGILVTAGFTFNEVFYYRFPNFAFAFILLAAALIVQFIPAAVKNVILVISVFCCFGGMTALTAYGLISEPAVAFESSNENVTVMSLLPLIMIFAGIDRVRVILRQQPSAFRISFFLTVFLLACWLTVSARFVEPQRLISSTIPYMTAAWVLGGEPGRLIMGLVIISGSFAAVCGLLSVSAFSIRNMSAWQQGDYLEKGIMVVVAAAVGTMMAAGVAGTTILELYIRSSLLLWLVYTGLSVFSGALLKRKKKPYQAGLGMTVSLFILLCSLAIFFNQQKLVVAVIFALSMITGSVLLITFLNFTSGYLRSDDVGKKNNMEV